MPRLRILIPTALLVCGCVSAQTAGRLSGKLLTADTSASIAGATVVAMSPLVGSPGVPPVIAHAVADEEGRFLFSDLPAGPYRLCVHDAGLYLDPCQWSQGVQATAGLDGPVTEVRLQRGVRLAVRVVDRAGLVSLSKERDELSAALPGALVTAALVDAQGRTRYLPFTRSDGRLYEYSLLAPPEREFTLTVRSHAFSLSDEAGGAASPSLSFPIKLSFPPPPDPRQRLPFAQPWPPATVVAVNTVAVDEVAP